MSITISLLHREPGTTSLMLPKRILSGWMGITDRPAKEGLGLYREEGAAA